MLRGRGAGGRPSLGVLPCHRSPAQWGVGPWWWSLAVVTPALSRGVAEPPGALPCDALHPPMQRPAPSLWRGCGCKEAEQRKEGGGAKEGGRAKAARAVKPVL